MPTTMELAEARAQRIEQSRRKSFVSGGDGLASGRSDRMFRLVPASRTPGFPPDGTDEPVWEAGELEAGSI